MREPSERFTDAEAFVVWAMDQPTGRFELVGGEVVRMASGRAAGWRGYSGSRSDSGRRSRLNAPSRADYVAHALHLPFHDQTGDGRSRFSDFSAVEGEAVGVR